MLYLVFFSFLCLRLDFAFSSCYPLSFGNNKFVCVCNKTFCDELKLLDNVPEDHAALYETNKSGARFQSDILPFSREPPEVPVVEVNNSKMYQFILGFGGAFTDAAGINIKSLPPELQEKVLVSYFSDEGLSYNMGRVPMASCDFSTYPYSYDDVPNDFELKHFQLAKEDFLFKIPLIQKAATIAKKNLILFGSPWSAPAWMKTNNAMNGKGTLKGNPGEKYYKTWANYFVRFLQEYKKNNITFWGLTMQNEPTDGCIHDFPFQSMCFPPEKQREFLKMDLGPALQKAGFGVDNLKLMILDDNRFMLPKWAEVILADEEAAQYVSGIAFHWYLGFISPYKLLDLTHEKFPGVFFLASEACAGWAPWEHPKVDLGNWDRAESYASDIIQDLLHWSIGWIDWNLALNMEGGPNWVKNFVDAPIIINNKTGEFYKQPTYYILAQFSKCLPSGSYRIGLQIPDAVMNLNNFYIAAFQTPQNKKVIIVVNRNEANVNLALHDVTKGYLNIIVSAHGIQTYEW